MSWGLDDVGRAMRAVQPRAAELLNEPSSLSRLPYKPKRVRVVGGPWPERIGAVGVIVPKLRREYPWVGLGRNEVVVLLDDDPLGRTDGRDWTHVIDQRDLAPVREEP